MAQSINLIPQEERQEQQKVKVVKMSSVLAILVLFIVAGVSAYYWYSLNNLRSQIQAKDQEIEAYRTDIQNLSEMEILARRLDSKYKIVAGLYSSRRLYSDLLVELEKRIPAGAQLESFSLTGDNKNTLNLSGVGIDYNAIARFIATLSDDEYDAAAEEYKNLFSSVTLNSVNLDSQNLSVEYFIVAVYSYELLNR